MARQFPDMSVTIRLGDLLEANKALVREVRKEVEAEVAEREKVAGAVSFRRMTSRRWSASIHRPCTAGRKPAI